MGLPGTHLPGTHWVDLRRRWLDLQPPRPRGGDFSKKRHYMTQSSAKAMSDFTRRLPWLHVAVAVLWSLGVAILYLDVDVAYCNRHKLYRIFVHQEFPQEL